MKKLLLCNGLFLKRSLKKFSFLCLLLLMMVLCYLLKDHMQKDGTSLRAGIYIEAPDTKAEQIAKSLSINYDSVEFFYCSSLEDLKQKVASKTYECGYVFPEGFSSKLEQGDLKEIVDVYYSPATFLTAMTNEYVFGEIFKEYAFYELMTYLSKREIFDVDVMEYKDSLRKVYDDYVNGDQTFAFEYIDSEHHIVDNSKLLSSYVLLSIRGFVALLIMIVAFIGTFNLYKDEKAGIFRALTPLERPLCKMAEIFSLTMLACVIGFLTLQICGQITNVSKEIVNFLIYACICTVYCFILHKIARNTYIFAGCIPFFVLGSILFCPIFIDISTVLPYAKYVSYAFLPKYFISSIPGGLL